jgi:broad specificity phosphatase PhoE
VTRLILCRHAEEGDEAQVRELAQALVAARVAAVYTSPLDRAQSTARAVAALHGLAPVVVAELREIERGDVEGLAFDEYPSELQAELLASPASVRFPGGETYDELRVRVEHALMEIVARHTEQTIVAVSHAGAIRAAFAAWLEVPAPAAFRIDQSFAGVNVVDWIGGAPLVRLVNGSLGWPAALGRHSMRA